MGRGQVPPPVASLHRLIPIHPGFHLDHPQLLAEPQAPRGHQLFHHVHLLDSRYQLRHGNAGGPSWLYLGHWALHHGADCRGRGDQCSGTFVLILTGPSLSFLPLPPLWSGCLELCSGGEGWIRRHGRLQCYRV